MYVNDHLSSYETVTTIPVLHMPSIYARFEHLYESQIILVRFAGAMLHSRRVGMKHALP